MTLEARTELAKREELRIVDRSRRAEHRVHERRRMARREDEVIVRKCLGLVELVAKVTGEQHGHEIGGGQRRCRMARSSGSRTADAVRTKLARQRAVQIEARRGLAHG